jgi:hypothetical protein
VCGTGSDTSAWHSSACSSQASTLRLWQTSGSEIAKVCTAAAEANSPVCRFQFIADSPTERAAQETRQKLATVLDIHDTIGVSDVNRVKSLADSM